MCRLLTARFTHATHPRRSLTAFAKMAKESKSLDGDWQGDGWGIAWLTPDNTWKTYHSLKPVWEDQEVFERVPETRSIVVHARSASFPHHKGVLEYNQPYVAGPYAFAFNGLVRGVALPPVPGRIGSEKIWHLLQQELATYPPEQALQRLKDLIKSHSQEVFALNIGLATHEGMHSLNEFKRFPEYYQFHAWKDALGEYLCSEPLDLP